MDEDDHYADFRRTVSFLDPEETRSRAFEADLGAYRRELYHLGSGDGGEIETFKTKGSAKNRFPFSGVEAPGWQGARSEEYPDI